MKTHRLKDSSGKWHDAGRSSSRPGTFVEWKPGSGPKRLWMAGQFDSKSVELIK